MAQAPVGKHKQENDDLTSFGFIGHVHHPLELLSLMRLLLKSFLNSEETGLTGAFFYDGTNIGEIVEGSAKAIESRWQAIRSDATFEKLKIIGKKKISTRHYSSWCMHAKDGELVCELYPELKKIIGEYTLKKSVFETIVLACETNSPSQIHVGRARSLQAALH
jgi:hypothetical protein